MQNTDMQNFEIEKVMKFLDSIINKKGNITRNDLDMVNNLVNMILQKDKRGYFTNPKEDVYRRVRLLRRRILLIIASAKIKFENEWEEIGIQSDGLQKIR